MLGLHPRLFFHVIIKKNPLRENFFLQICQCIFIEKQSRSVKFRIVYVIHCFYYFYSFQYQFVLIFLYVSNAMTYKYTPTFNHVSVNLFFWIHWFYMISLFWLFQHFYQGAYRAKKLTDEEKTKKQQVVNKSALSRPRK